MVSISISSTSCDPTAPRRTMCERLLNEEVDAAKNEAFAKLIQFLQDKSLLVVMCEAVDDGRTVLKRLLKQECVFMSDRRRNLA